MKNLVALFVLLAAAPGCFISTVGGHERALFYSAGGGLHARPVGPGWYFHLPWNHYEKYDLRWHEHSEQIHLHTKDGLHLDLDISVVVRPAPNEIFDLDVTAGHDYYSQLVKPALFAAVRDGGGQFNHLDVATHTHEVEQAMRAAILEHLKGRHIEVGEIAIQHFDLPPEVEHAANRTAASAQLIAAKKVDLELAQKDAEIIKEQRRGAIEADGLERQLRAEQELAAAQQQLQIEEAKRKSERERQEAEAEAVELKAQAEAKAVELAAEADRMRLTPAYVKLRALELLAAAMSNGKDKVLVLPAGTNGMPQFWAPFLNPASMP